MAVISPLVLIGICLYFLFLSLFIFLHEIMNLYKPKCEFTNRGTFIYSDFEYPCKKDEEYNEWFPEEIFESEIEGEEGEKRGGGGEGDTHAELHSVKIESKELEKNESAEKGDDVSVSKKSGVIHTDEKAKIQIEPCYIPPEQKSENLLSRWKEMEKRNFYKDVMCPEPLDSYEKLLLQPFCPPWPPSPIPESPSESSFMTGIRLGMGMRMGAGRKGSLPTLFCVLCEGDLYENGPLHDLHVKTENIKRQSFLKNDKVKKLIGIRTRITVHKICYEEYTKLFVKDSENQEASEI